jgi:hypothetical protein
MSEIERLRAELARAHALCNSLERVERLQERLAEVGAEERAAARAVVEAAWRVIRCKYAIEGDGLFRGGSLQWIHEQTRLDRQLYEALVAYDERRQP